MASGFSFDLPRLTFPEPEPTITARTCDTPSVLSPAPCTAK
jgi:hypothetical protein